MPSLRHLLPAALLTLLTLLTLLSLPPLLSLLHLAAGLSFSQHMGWPPLPCFPPLISPTPSFLDVARRRRRRSYSLVRTRLLRPAPPSEADRGCARSVPGRKDAGKPDGACAGHRPRLRLPERRHVRVPPRSSSSLHPAPCTLQPVPCTLHAHLAPCTHLLHPAPCTLQARASSSCPEVQVAVRVAVAAAAVRLRYSSSSILVFRWGAHTVPSP